MAEKKEKKINYCLANCGQRVKDKSYCPDCRTKYYGPVPMFISIGPSQYIKRKFIYNNNWGLESN